MVSLLMLALTGAFDTVSMVIRQTLVQLLTPDEMRGRVSAVTSIFVGASNELGGLESGLVAHWFGPVFSAVSGGIGTIMVVIGAAFLSPELRNYGPLVGSVKAPPTPAIVPPVPQPEAQTQTVVSQRDVNPPVGASDD
jgi:hypothetical protein